MPQGSDEYITAFRDGAELVLRGLEGRLDSTEMDEAARARLREFLDDYQRLTEACIRAREVAGDGPRAPSIHEFLNVLVLN